MKRLLFLLSLLCWLPPLPAAPGHSGRWFAETGPAGRAVVSPAADGTVGVEADRPGTLQLYFERERTVFRPGPADFAAGELSLEARLLPGNGEKSGGVRGYLFVKDKDGLWFQTEREILVEPGDFQKFSVRLDEPGRNFRPVGHAGAWNAAYAVNILAAGISLFGLEQRSVRLECRNLEFAGERRRLPLRILDWELPERGEAFERLESRFKLSREYLNPFDPDEIKVDFEFQGPDGKVCRYPAFYTQDFRRELQGVREVLSPIGLPYWAFRFTPPAAGACQLRLTVEDRSGAEPVILYSPWRSLTVAESSRRGFVRVSRRRPAYLEFSNGEFFFPVGLNIHTNTDLRSEFRFDFGHLPDRGTFDYDEYFDACGRNGITAVEVWMASWTCGLEWDAAREFYHGLGRYNLANAFRLDHMLDRAGQNGIYLNLVLDNHGKTSVDNDQEWDDNPFYSEAVFAAANGGFLADAGDFFTDPQVKKYNSQRNRYIAARWGADPRILAVELWSEVNLVARARETLANGAMARWHAETAAEYTAMSQAKHLITTHTSGDWKTSLSYRPVFEIPEHTHWAGDAYRNDRIHMVDQMREQAKNMNFPKPVLITEYGGASQGGAGGKILADVHAGQWSSFFLRQAGSPFLWWHDFVHIYDYYRHYRGFAEFIAGVDLRELPFHSEPKVKFFRPGRAVKPKLDREANADLGQVLEARNHFLPFRRESRFLPLDPALYRYESLAVGNRERIYGWIFNREAMFVYPEDPAAYPVADGLAVDLPHDLEPGRYRVRFFDPVGGEAVFDATIRHAGGMLRLPVFPFRLDIAYKLEKTE